jgi:hypothetical protein
MANTACRAYEAAFILALVDGVVLEGIGETCPDPVAFVVSIDRREIGMHLDAEVCAGHQALMEIGVVGYQRAIKKHVPS